MKTSRTAVLTYQDCPRKRYFSFHVEGHGYTSSKTNLNLLVGQTVHRGLQHLLDHCLREHPNGDITETCIKEALDKAQEVYDTEIAKGNGFALPLGDKTEYEFVYKEQWALCEALIWAYALIRIPTFFQEFEVLEVEKEESMELGPNVEFLAKADGLLRGRADNKLYVLSYKTAGDFPPVTMRNILHDMQGMSEICVIEERLGALFLKFRKWQDEFNNSWNREQFIVDENISPELLKYFISHYENSNSDKITCHAVQYEFLIKGPRRQDPYNSGNYKQQSFLIHPYKSNAVVNFFNAQVVSGNEFKWKTGKGRMPAGWEKIDIWEDIGVREWIEMLARGEVQPEEGNPFEWILISPEAVVRDRYAIQEWKRSTSYQEESIAGYIEEIANPNEWDANAWERRLAQLFPKHTNRCHDYYGHDCTFVSVCHEGKTIQELVQIGGLRVREPHHEAELNEFKERGFID